MKNLVLVYAVLLVGCGKNAENSRSTAQALDVQAACQYQGETPYGNGIEEKVYLCTQFTPACTVKILSSPALDQVPAIVADNCPKNVAQGQVP